MTALQNVCLTAESMLVTFYFTNNKIHTDQWRFTNVQQNFPSLDWSKGNVTKSRNFQGGKMNGKMAISIFYSFENQVL